MPGASSVAAAFRAVVAQVALLWSCHFARHHVPPDGLSSTAMGRRAKHDYAWLLELVEIRNDIEAGRSSAAVRAAGSVMRAVDGHFCEERTSDDDVRALGSHMFRCPAIAVATQVRPPNAHPDSELGRRGSKRAARAAAVLLAETYVRRGGDPVWAAAALLAGGAVAATDPRIATHLQLLRTTRRFPYLAPAIADYIEDAPGIDQERAERKIATWLRSKQILGLLQEVSAAPGMEITAYVAHARPKVDELARHLKELDGRAADAVDRRRPRWEEVLRRPSLRAAIEAVEESCKAMVLAIGKLPRRAVSPPDPADPSDGARRWSRLRGCLPSLRRAP